MNVKRFVIAVSVTITLSVIGVVGRDVWVKARWECVKTEKRVRLIVAGKAVFPSEKEVCVEWKKK